MAFESVTRVLVTPYYCIKYELYYLLDGETLINQLLQYFLASMRLHATGLTFCIRYTNYIQLINE